jgi:hypothetical protein
MPYQTPSERLRELYQAGKVSPRDFARLYGQCTHEQIDELLNRTSHEPQ